MNAPHSTAAGPGRQQDDHAAQTTNMAAPVQPAADLATNLAIERTRVAYDRTMMAWVRTATSLITFGFTVYKFFQLQRYGDFERRHKIGPREFGLALVGIGLFSLILAAWDNRHNMRALRIYDPTIPRSRATILGALIFMLGMAGLIVMILRE